MQNLRPEKIHSREELIQIIGNRFYELFIFNASVRGHHAKLKSNITIDFIDLYSFMHWMILELNLVELTSTESFLQSLNLYLHQKCNANKHFSYHVDEKQLIERTIFLTIGRIRNIFSLSLKEELLLLQDQADKKYPRGKLADAKPKVRNFLNDLDNEIINLKQTRYSDDELKQAKIMALYQLKLHVLQYNNVEQAMLKFLYSKYTKNQTYYQLFSVPRRAGRFFAFFGPKKTSTQALIDKYFNRDNNVEDVTYLLKNGVVAKKGEIEKPILNDKEDHQFRQFKDDLAKELHRIEHAHYGDQTIKNYKLTSLKNLKRDIEQNIHKKSLTAAVTEFLKTRTTYADLHNPTYGELFSMQRRTGFFSSLFKPSKTGTQKFLDKYSAPKNIVIDETTPLLHHGFDSITTGAQCYRQ